MIPSCLPPPSGLFLFVLGLFNSFHSLLFQDAVIKVPLGTVVYSDNGHVLRDMNNVDSVFLVAR